jgi:hypothetical protein
MDLIADLLTATRAQLARDLEHLQKLRSSVRNASFVIERATVAYRESCSLLEQMDGVPSSPVEAARIHIPD